MYVVGVGRISISSVIEKIISRYDVNEMYVHIDPISLKVASDIAIEKVRRVYIETIDEILFRIMESPGKFIFLVSPKSADICSLFELMKKIVHISQRNENIKRGMVIFLATSKSIFYGIIDYVLKYDLPIHVPMDINSVASSGVELFVDGNKKVSIVVIEPEIIDMEIVGKEIDFKSMESNIVDRPITHGIRIGHGKLGVVGLGYILSVAMDVINESELNDRLTLYGLFRIDSSVREEIREILSKHKNILFLGCKKVVGDIVRSIAEDLIENGEIDWVPNITFAEDFFDNIETFGKQAIKYVLFNVLGLGEIDNSMNISAYSRIRLSLHKGVIDILDRFREELGHEVIALSPLYDRNIKSILSDMFEVLNHVLLGGKNYIILAHLCDLNLSIDMLKNLSEKFDGKMVIIAVSEYMTENLRKQLTKKISNSLQQSMLILSIDDGLEKILKKVKKRNKALVVL